MKKEIEESNQEQAVDLLKKIVYEVDNTLEDDGIWPATTHALELIRAEALQNIEYCKPYSTPNKNIGNYKCETIK